jgi:molybdenum cofactor cytidylyltransferase
VIGEIIQTRRAREEAEPWPGPVEERRLHAVVLAAGAGTRYGGPKLLAKRREGVVLDGALAAAFAAPAASVTVVTGAHGEAVASAARAFAAARPDGARLRIVHAPDYAEGLSASLKRGVAALPADAEAAFLFLGDMPEVPAEVLAPLARALAGGATAAAPVYAGRRGHPVLVSRALFSALASLRGDRGAGAILEGLGPALALVPAADEGVLFDIDTPQDLTRAAFG